MTQPSDRPDAQRVTASPNPTDEEARAWLHDLHQSLVAFGSAFGAAKAARIIALLPPKAEAEAPAGGSLSAVAKRNFYNQGLAHGRRQALVDLAPFAAWYEHAPVALGRPIAPDTLLTDVHSGSPTPCWRDLAALAA